MIVENISQTTVVSFYLHVEGKSEYITIEPGKYIFINETNWTVENIKNFVEHIQADKGDIKIIGTRKNYDVGTKHPTKEELTDRFDLIDLDE